MERHSWNEETNGMNKERKDSDRLKERPNTDNQRMEKKGTSRGECCIRGGFGGYMGLVDLFASLGLLDVHVDTNYYSELPFD